MEQKLEPKCYFKKAVPVWKAGCETEYNQTLGFQGCFSKNSVTEKVTIRIAASTIYRAYLNGELLGYGPARAAHDYYRVDEYEAEKRRLKEENILTVEVVGFNINSFAYLDQPSFLQAEVSEGEAVLAATGTGADSMKAKEIADRVQKVQRYSYQRVFMEVYRLAPGYDAWRTEAFRGETERLAQCGTKQLLEQHVHTCKFEVSKVKAKIAQGTFQSGCEENELWKNRAFYNISDSYKGYKVDELEVNVSAILDQTNTLTLQSVPAIPFESGCELKTGEFAICDLGMNRTGMLRIGVTCKEDTVLVMTMDELLTEGDIFYRRMSSVNGIYYELKKGSYVIETIQPYNCRYMKPMVYSGDAVVTELSVREYKNPDAGRAKFFCSDPVLESIFEAGRETFAQNAPDIYMDCPSRERAGWLCDSFFTGRVEPILTGETLVEDNFLENYCLPETFANLPDGMVPMCYPSDHTNGSFIPNWAMWMILEFEEYQKRNPKQKLGDTIRRRVEGVFRYLEQYENEDGLLENLDSWIFVEWSRANELVKGVNYPTNMVYAGIMDAAARMFGREEWAKKAETIRETIREQSFSGEFFRDQSLRLDGRLVRTEESTEVCQYYAFFFGIADDKRYPELFRTMLEKFGPGRDTKKVYPEVGPANAFIGNYLRLEILSRYGLADQIIKETKGFFQYMVERTGTLWELVSPTASCNHGFASHVTYLYCRDLLGLKKIDHDKKEITVSVPECALEYCKGIIPVGDGYLEYGWKKENGKTVPEYRLSEGLDYTVVEE
ncbi:MAG: hypothetical protein J6B85_08410 [Lachnospiraceae bacterium]|nr:hypothetical protein [Lachnospiraceae bacterium]